MFKKLLEFVLALALALGACSAVFAEEDNFSGWSEGEKEIELDKINDLYNYLLSMDKLLRSLHESMEIDSWNTFWREEYGIESVNESGDEFWNDFWDLDEYMDEVFTDMDNIKYGLGLQYDDPDYKKSDYINDIDSLEKVLVSKNKYLSALYKNYPVNNDIA